MRSEFQRFQLKTLEFRTHHWKTWDKNAQLKNAAPKKPKENDIASVKRLSEQRKRKK